LSGRQQGALVRCRQPNPESQHSAGGDTAETDVQSTPLLSARRCTPTYDLHVSIELDPRAFVWCVAGQHIGETLQQIVDRKQADIDKFGWCLWAYGGGGVGHPDKVRHLAHRYGDGETLVVLMPDTGKSSPIGQSFDHCQASPTSPVQLIPEGMSPVTGGTGSWAFWITSIDWLPDSAIDVSRYAAPDTPKGIQHLPRYLRGSHGRACASRMEDPTTSHSPDLRTVDVAGTLKDPFAVFLVR